jgi:16S rRNA (cytosine1402-N4)-methyltransferase
MSDAISDLHMPVLRDEVVTLLSLLAGKTLVDGTVGLGGHSEALLRADSSVRVIGVDRDAEALALASERLSGFGARFTAIHGDFRTLRDLLQQRGVSSVDGILLDIGVSSLQLDASERGFSFRQDGPLDMRMDRTGARTAADWIETASESELTDVLFRYGEERYARRIARAILAARADGGIASTLQLAEIVRRAVPADYDHRRLHPATRTFQAVRMAVNDELAALEAGLSSGFELLAVGGILAVITFHSLEDRIVKWFFRTKAQACICPPELPECVCDKQVEAKILTPRPVTASAEEVKANPRARSAKLRAAERLR